jgi:phage gp36-like protein
MATNFKYASQSDLKNYFNNFGDFDQKTQIFPSGYALNMATFQDSGYTDMLFVNGEEQTKVTDTPNSNGEWKYTASTNLLQYFDSTLNEQVFETGADFETFIDQQLVNASMELNNLLDARFQMPLPKSTQIKEGAASGLTPEYDPVIIKCTCYIAAANLIRSKDPMSEEAQFYMDMVSNVDGTGLVDKMNGGQIKLSFEIDNKDSQGSIREVTRAGSMYLVETAGEFYGGNNGYDLLRITCTTGGAYGVAKCKVEYYGNDKLFGQEETDNIVTGTLDNWGGLNGIQVRFQGSSMTADDQWEIEVYNEGMEETNSVTRNISLHR